jgi:hypothetical protein
MIRVAIYAEDDGRLASALVLSPPTRLLHIRPWRRHD